jgi:hypothetical protein
MMITALAAVLAGFGMVLFTAPANAEDGFWGASECIHYDGSGPLRDKTSCLKVRWNEQGDGDGVTLEWVEMNTTDGCSWMPSPFPYHDVEAKLYHKTDATPVYKNWDWEVETNCDWHKDIQSVNGADGNPSRFRASMCVGANRLIWVVRIYGGGNREWLQSNHTDTGDTGC